MAVKLSVVYLSYNEEDIVASSLDSVANLADEIIFVDSGSTDSTPEIAKRFGARWYDRPLVNWGEQRNWALQQCSYPWILVLDCDEVLCPELQTALSRFKNSDPALKPHSFRRIHEFMGRTMRFSGLGNDWVVRLLPRGTEFEQLFVHEKVNEPSIKLDGALQHFTYKSEAHWAAKMRSYAVRQAKDYDKRTGTVTAYHKLLKPSFRFFKHFILKGGIFDGRQGWHYSCWMYKAVKWRYNELEKLREQ